MITIFKNIYETTQPYHIELDVELERIRTGQYKEQIEHIRSLKDKRARDKNKEQLPSVLFSGKFNGRTDDTLIEHSGLICLDFDGTTDKEGLINEYTLAAFLSPSGNGVKVLVKIPKDAPNHHAFGLSLHKKKAAAAVNIVIVLFITVTFITQSFYGPDIKKSKKF